ncbi:CHASE2 domain-containing protein [Anaerobaca lacustris]|uniref:Adenylate/guanylate cyclase domain-containing protein n=1 Tax=Anaerobaca lacustris TaxID=3044600 RepID=A0AAW6TY66_9BACT|nr:adenylate/guanylate cyclase domain-containing protein [Sedimentisphaerales bacterium M17dextr]
MPKLRGKCVRALLIGLSTAAAALLVWQLGALESWEAPTWAWRARFFSARETLSPEIKLILLDQTSLDWAQRENGWGWPWPREVYGAISAFCERGGARALALDLLFTEPSVYGVSDDEAMGEALKSGPPAVLALMPGGSVETWPESMPRPDRTTTVAAAIEPNHLLFPVPEVAAGAMAFGHVAGLPDADGVFRRISPFCRFDGIEIPALGLATYLATEPSEVTADVRRLQIGDSIVPLDERGDAILRFRGRDGLPEAVSAAAVIQSELRLRDEEPPVLSPDTFKDCYVFVGCSAPALLDLRPTPVNPKCPGVILHATFVDNLITKSFIAKAGGPAVALGVLATAVGAALSLTYGGRWWQAGPLSVFWLGIPMLIGFAAYARGWWWPVAVHETAAGLALVGALAMNYWAEGRQKAFIKQAFRHYLSGEVIEKIIRDPKHLQLGGEKREMTIMFTDLAGFSTFSEKLGPVELTTLLNDYLSEMTDIIMEEGGTLDKYEGDAIIAFWNAPLAQSDHAVRACRAALRCQRRLAELRDGFQQRTGAVLRMRVGLNTGDVVVGNMGSRKRFNYTILGDAANLAARLEGANKAFGTETMVSDGTWRQAGSEFRGRKLADLRVVGRKTAVEVYELTGFAADPAPAGWETFAAGLALFRKGDFAGAKAVFERLPDDPAARSYAQRCAHLAAHPPTSWDGVWGLTEK